MAQRVQKKWAALKAAGYRIVAIDQHTQVVKTEQTRGWFPVNSRPRLPVSGGRESLNLLGAVTDDGECFFSSTEAHISAQTAVHFVKALQYEFGQQLAVVLDNAGYFTAKDFKKAAAEAGVVLEYLPPYAPDLNPVEQCWRQLTAGRANRLFRSFTDLKAHLRETLPTITPPNIYEYLC